MAEYIEREETVRTALTAINDFMGFTDTITLIRIATRIREIPAADVVEVVRCKKCKHYDINNNYCEQMGFNCNHYDFCSYGERRSDNG